MTARRRPRFGLPLSWAPNSLLLVPGCVPGADKAFLLLYSSVFTEAREEMVVS